MKKNILAPGEIHIWRIDLAPDNEAAGVPENSLDADEDTRAASLREPAAQRRFRQCHQAKRVILGRYLEQPAKDLAIRRTPLGKPFLADAGTDLRFNLSHTGEQAMLALCLGAEIGVDIEQHRTGRQLLEIAARYFAPPLVEALTGMPPEQQACAFYGLWTRLEAYKKAMGEGLRGGEPLLQPPLQPPLDDFLPLATASGDWLVAQLTTALGYSAAVALQDGSRAAPAICYFDY